MLWSLDDFWVVALSGIVGVGGATSGACNVAIGGTGIDFVLLEVDRAGGTTLGSQEWCGDDAGGATLDSWTGRVANIGGIFAGGATLGSWTGWVGIVGGIVFGTGSCCCMGVIFTLGSCTVGCGAVARFNI